MNSSPYLSKITMCCCSHLPDPPKRQLHPFLNILIICLFICLFIGTCGTAWVERSKATLWEQFFPFHGDAADKIQVIRFAAGLYPLNQWWTLSFLPRKERKKCMSEYVCKNCLVFFVCLFIGLFCFLVLFGWFCCCLFLQLLIRQLVSLASPGKLEQQSWDRLWQYLGIRTLTTLQPSNPIPWHLPRRNIYTHTSGKIVHFF